MVRRFTPAGPGLPEGPPAGDPRARPQAYPLAMRVRRPAVAGTFYPDDPVILAGTVDGYVASAERVASAGAGAPRAVIAPHAGYLYSGPVAGSAFAAVPRRAPYRRVVVLGPSHYVPFRGLALPTAEVFATPLGEVPVDADAASALADLPQVVTDDEPHRREHSLEVELPFLQRRLGEFRVVPLSVGDAAPDEVAEVIERLDLSHYHRYDVARRIDARTSAAIEALDADAIGEGDACGRVPLRGLLARARARGWTCRRLDLRNSGDTAGPDDRVVGYGAYVLG
jgi:AmmeMemoRadiSam system protein B